MVSYLGILRIKIIHFFNAKGKTLFYSELEHIKEFLEEKKLKIGNQQGIHNPRKQIEDLFTALLVVQL